MLKNLNRYQDLGLLILRLGVGTMFLFHGYPKITGGPETWTKIGGAMKHVGISFMPTFFGFMAAFAEFFGGVMLILGLLTPVAALLMMTTMLVASIMHVANGDPFPGVVGHPLKMAFVFAGLIFIGGGRYSLDAKLWPGSMGAPEQPPGPRPSSRH